MNNSNPRRKLEKETLPQFILLKNFRLEKVLLSKPSQKKLHTLKTKENNA